MSSLDIEHWVQKKERLKKLVGQMESIGTQVEEVTNYLYPSAAYMDGNTIGNKSYDDGVLASSYDSFAQVYVTLLSIKEAAVKEMNNLESKIVAERNRLKREQNMTTGSGATGGTRPTSGCGGVRTSTR